MIPIRYNVRSLVVRKANSLATAFGIALVAFVLASSLMLAAGIRKTLGSGGKPDNAIVLRVGSETELGSVVDQASVSVVLAMPGIRSDERGQPLAVAEVVAIAAMEKTGGDGVTSLAIRGVSEDVTRFRPEVRLVAGRAPRAGTNEAMVGARMRGRITGLELGQSFELKKSRPVAIVGVFEADGSAYESEVWVDRDVLLQAFGRQGIVSSVRVRLDSPSTFAPFRAGVEGDKRLGLEVLRETDFYDKQSEGSSTFVAALGIGVAFFFAVGAMIGATITMHAAVANRRREIGTLRALGFSRTSILTSFLLESVLLASLGGAVGAAASVAMGLVHFSMVNATSWSEVVFSFDPTPRVIGVALAFACGMGIVGGFLPAVRAARTSPLTALRA